MADFTKGKWIVDRETWEGDGAAGVLITNGNRNIAFITEWTDRGEPEEVSDEDRANGQLIARAPLMNEQLRLLAIQFRDYDEVMAFDFNEIMETVSDKYMEGIL